MNIRIAGRLLSLTMLALLCFFVPSFKAAALGAAPAAPQGRSIRSWVHCDGKDESAGVTAAFAAAKNGAFPLIVDCPVVIHVGTDIRRPIYIDNGTTVQFTQNGLFTVDNELIPAFVIANSSKVRLLGWRVQYKGGIPVNPDVGGYYDNGKFVASKGYDQPAFNFNDHALAPWLTANRGIHFTEISSPWAGPTDTSSIFYLLGSTNDVQVQDMKVFVAPNAKGSQFAPMVFASIFGYKSNQNVSRQTPNTSQYFAVPNNISFSNIDLDGYYMGWQGSFQNALFEHIRTHRYGDLQDDQGGNVGGIKKWFAPPHLFYLTYDPKKTGLENQNIRILDVIDYGNRVGVARDRGGSDTGSGYANSLKIGGFNSEVNGYKSYRPDGVLDLLISSNLTISNVEATYDSSFLNNIYPGIRFPAAPYKQVTLENISITDKAPVSRIEPIGSTFDTGNSGIVLKNVRGNLNAWAKAPAAGASNLKMAVRAAAVPAAAPQTPLTSLCPGVRGAVSTDIQFTVSGQVQKCTK
jgi:hypothetical protein